MNLLKLKFKNYKGELKSMDLTQDEMIDFVREYGVEIIEVKYIG